MYDFDVSTSTFSRITNAVTTEMVAWQNRPLEDLYLIVWMDGIVFKVRENSKIVNKTIYLAVGLNRRGKKESSSFWMSVLTVLKARGVEDILITATDYLNGFYLDGSVSLEWKSSTFACSISNASTLVLIHFPLWRCTFV